MIPSNSLENSPHLIWTGGSYTLYLGTTMKKNLLFFALFFARLHTLHAQTQHDLHFNTLATQWDEAIPLGNGMLGALVWEKEQHLRLSLDRADLWDQRPMAGLHRPEFSYGWVQRQVAQKEYNIVQQYFDAPYDREPAPSKIPGGALEFDTRNWGKSTSAQLHVNTGICEVTWANGAQLSTFVHATVPVGWFRFTHLTGPLLPDLIAPRYQGSVKVSGDPVGGDDLSRLGYQQGKITHDPQHIQYTQEGWNGFSYQIDVRWKVIGKGTVEGSWSITAHPSGAMTTTNAAATTLSALQRGLQRDLKSHTTWWKKFWRQSSLHVPDPVIEKQWYLEQYKFGSASRRGAPPISLQAVWTADNGRIPPWKGDYHHDLNTQLSYWPCYSGNHLEEGLVYFDHLDANKDNYRRYTRQYFGKEGLCVPGVTTLDGTEMGGWIQYSLSPTVSAWLAQHYYLHWKYSMDQRFLKERAYPWLKETAVFLQQITIKDASGFRKLPISASPEINDNSLSAWFQENTNYDLALMKFVFNAAAEMALALDLKTDAAGWQKTAAEFGDYSLSPNNELQFAPSLPQNVSHRHFSQLMAIHPLGLLRWEDGPQAQAIIKNSLHLLDSIGPGQWCGYSYAWLANLKARAKDGDGAANALDIFANAFCSSNSFHLNGDQSGKGYSSFTYRPFTLEGNFAFAAGLQEMLLQSYAGFIDIMPAIPPSWENVSFDQLRAEGAFLVSAKREKGKLLEIKIVAEKGGIIRLKLPAEEWHTVRAKGIATQPLMPGMLELTCEPEGVIVFSFTKI
jgi:alpha-L-fucosidase 2